MELSVGYERIGACPSRCARIPKLQKSSRGGVPATRRPSVSCQAASVSTEAHKLGLLLECDGILCDTHAQGHRVAFNHAFQELGLKHIQLSPALYHELLRSGNGSAEGLLATYFNTVGWPVSIPEEERRGLVGRLHAAKRRHLLTLVDNAALPLRPGVEGLVNDALQSGAQIGILACTCSTVEERVVEAVMNRLGADRSECIRVFSCDQGPNRDEGESSGRRELSLDQSWQDASARRKRSEAEAFVDTVNGPGWRAFKKELEAAAGMPGQLAAAHVGTGLAIDPGLLAAARRSGMLLPAWLAACIATMGTSLRHTAMLGANARTVRAGQAAGCLGVAIPPPLSGRGEFKGADLVCDGFGAGGGATFNRIAARLVARP